MAGESERAKDSFGTEASAGRRGASTGRPEESSGRYQRLLRGRGALSGRPGGPCGAAIHGELRARLLLMGLSGAVYLLLAGNLRCNFQPTAYVHHNYLADAFLRGQLHVSDAGLQHLRQRAAAYADRVVAHRRRQGGMDDAAAKALHAEAIEHWWVETGLHDWTIENNRLYGYWGPLLAVVNMPFFLLGGFDASDRLMSSVMGMVNVGLFHWLLTRLNRAGLLATRGGCRAGLTVLFAFGTVHFWIACSGSVWFAAQLVTLTALLASWVAMAGPANRAADVLLAGVFFGAAMLGRNIVGLMGLFYIVLIFGRRADLRRERRRFLVRDLALFLIPGLAAVGLQLAYNYARFGDLLETGQAKLIRETGNERFVADFNTYGQFHPHYFRKNAWYYLVNWNLPRGRDGEWLYDPDGNSMFLITPPLVYALLAWRRRSWATLAAAAGVTPFLVALLFFRATGWVQFGNRYLLEALPLLLLLVAAGMRGRVTLPGYVLIAAAVAINAWGVSLVLKAPLELPRFAFDWLVFPAGAVLAIAARLLWSAAPWHARPRAAAP